MPCDVTTLAGWRQRKAAVNAKMDEVGPFSVRYQNNWGKGRWEPGGGSYTRLDLAFAMLRHYAKKAADRGIERVQIFRDRAGEPEQVRLDWKTGDPIPTRESVANV